MRFTDPLFSRALPAVFALILCACATAPEAPSEEDGEPPPEPSALPSGPPTPNPYTSQRTSVPSQARARFEQVLEAMEREDWARAETLLLALSQDHPNLSGPHLNLGLVYRARGEPEQAMEAMERALEANANNLQAYNQLALLKREAGDFDAAERYYQQALEVWPYHAQSHKNLGILYDLYRGEWDQALLHYRAYQQLQDEPEREMAGWIIDLERRIEASQ